MSRNLDNYLTCKICANHYDLKNHMPMMLLNCQHSLCISCLYKIADVSMAAPKSQTASAIKCPFCNEPYNVPVHTIPRNNTIRGILEDGILPEQIPIEEPVDTATAPKARARAMPFNKDRYLRDEFNGIDTDKSGAIDAYELQSLLSKLMPEQFNKITVVMIIRMFDSDGNEEIDFYEFKNMYVYISDIYGDFLEADADESGAIDSDELKSLFDKHRFRFSCDFCVFVVKNIEAESKYNRLTFDYFCRLMARINRLRDNYKQRNRHESTTLEDYVRERLFSEFW